MRAAIYIITLLVTPLWAGTPEAMVLLKSNCFSCHNPEKEKKRAQHQRKWRGKSQRYLHNDYQRKPKRNAHTLKKRDRTKY